MLSSETVFTKRYPSKFSSQVVEIRKRNGFKQKKFKSSIHRSSLHGSLNPPFHEIPKDFIFSIVLVVFSKYILSFIYPVDIRLDTQRGGDRTIIGVTVMNDTGDR